MKWASSLSEKNDIEKAVAECAASLKKQMGDTPPDFICAFVSMAFSERYEDVYALVKNRIPVPAFTGCSAGGVIGGGREVEHKPGLSLVAASLPGVTLTLFSIQDEDIPDLDASPRAWEEMVGLKAADEPQFLLFADPYSIRSDTFLLGLDYAFPKSVKLGGLASGATRPGQNALYLNNLCLRSGLAGVAFTGNIRVDAIVSQGCRPIGKPFRITDCQENILLELDHKPPMEAVESVVETLSERDRELVQQSLFVGLVMDPQKENQGRGDFLIRNIIGVDQEKGYLAVGSPLRRGQMMQFHLRDADTSMEDLRHLLEKLPRKEKPDGAMLFSCEGRGRGLYGKPDHDSDLFHQKVGSVPLGGFFCNGEIGPVNGATYLHGYTSCFGLFRPRM